LPSVLAPRPIVSVTTIRALQRLKATRHHNLIIEQDMTGMIRGVPVNSSIVRQTIPALTARPHQAASSTAA
jgi:hypothetical protein